LLNEKRNGRREGRFIRTDRSDRAIDGERVVVDVEPVPVGVGVREESRLEDGIVRGLDSGNKMRRSESDLLDLVMAE
jgi:hypothetical protein